MGTRSMLAGMEVPIIGSDSVKFIDVCVPSSSSSSSPADEIAVDTSLQNAPRPEDFASCFAIGDPSAYLILRIQKALPRAVELLEVSTQREFPRIGLRLSFSETLVPFAFLWKNEGSLSARNPYVLYVLTLSGVVYLLKIRQVSTYASASNVSEEEILEYNLRSSPDDRPITSVAAAAGCLVVGRNDGSVRCIRLGSLDRNDAGFAFELRDDSAINRILGFVSRGRLSSPVQDLVISEVNGKKLLFVLHSDGVLRVWDLSSQYKVFSHSMTAPSLAVAVFGRLWVGHASLGLNMVPVAILCKHTEHSLERIFVYRISFSGGDRCTLLLEPQTPGIPLDDGECLDVKLTSEKIWVLKDNGLLCLRLFNAESHAEEAHCYALQEEFVADQLFQSSENSSDALLLLTSSVVSSSTEQILSSVSSIFLRRLLHPGVLHEPVLRTTMLDCNKRWTDSEFKSLTADGLRKEILSLAEHDSVMANPMSMFHFWKNFCARYYQHWCRDNAPCGLIIENSVGGVGVIRKSSLSLFRCLEDIEKVLDGASDELGDLSGAFKKDSEILCDVIKCISSIGQQLGKTSSAIFYELLVRTPDLPYEESFSRILRIVENGVNSSVATAVMCDLGSDHAWERGLTDHKNLRKFSIHMLLSLHALQKKADSWGRVLEIIESFLKYLVPRKASQGVDAEIFSHLNTSILVQCTSQVSNIMFESSLDILLFLRYLLSNSGQIQLSHDNISRIQFDLIPMVEEIISEWHVIHFIATTPSEPAAVRDFSSQLSLLHIDSNTGGESWTDKLGKCGFTLAFVILLNLVSSSGELSPLSSQRFPTPEEIITSTRGFSSLIIWGRTQECQSFLSNSIELASILLRHGQYDACEYLLSFVEARLQNEKTSQTIQEVDGGWYVLHHLLGCCLLAQAHYKMHGVLKERKVCEAIRCFFRASSGKESSQALHNLSGEAGLPDINLTGIASGAIWRFCYYQWAMQIFEQYSISEGACQFALAALELVDEAFSLKDEDGSGDPFNESVTTVKGRLWANVFKFTLDLDHFYDAYCAITSNPDEESKYICLRRFIIFLYERGATKVLCSGQLPFIGLTEKVEQELAWKAERSDILSKPSIYKLLYAFEMHQHNWRRAAVFMYLYSSRLRTEVATKDYPNKSSVLQERLNGLSAAINALHLVHRAYAWIDSVPERNHYPSKKVRRMDEEKLDSGDMQPQKSRSYIDIKLLEDEFVLSSAEYLLSTANVKWTFTGNHLASSELVDLLAMNNFNDMAFSVLLRFWKGSDLKRELERVFSAISLKCCPNGLSSSWVPNGDKTKALLLTSSKDDVMAYGSPEMVHMSQHSTGNSQWEVLELYLNKYNRFHPRLPVVVAETLLRADPQIELPLWLVSMFKLQHDSRRESSWGMTGQESNPATLLRLYVDYGRYTEATNLLLECIKSFASVQPEDLVKRKKPYAVWFPYTTIQRLWCHLDEMIRSGHMVDQCHKLKELLQSALLSHLKLLKAEEEDVISATS